MTGAWSSSIDYTYMKGNDAAGGAAANQFAATISYAFSARTKVYAEAIYQRTNSSTDGAWIDGLLSADSNQASYFRELACRHPFSLEGPGG